MRGGGGGSYSCAFHRFAFLRGGGNGSATTRRNPVISQVFLTLHFVFAAVFPHRSWCQGNQPRDFARGRAASRPKTQLERFPSATNPWHVLEASARLAVLLVGLQKLARWPAQVGLALFFCSTSGVSKRFVLIRRREKSPILVSLCSDIMFRGFSHRRMEV